MKKPGYVYSIAQKNDHYAVLQECLIICKNQMYFTFLLPIILLLFDGDKPWM